MLVAALTTDADNLLVTLSARKLNPDPATVLDPGDVLIAIGTGEQLASMGAALTGEDPRS